MTDIEQSAAGEPSTSTAAATPVLFKKRNKASGLSQSRRSTPAVLSARVEKPAENDIKESASYAGGSAPPEENYDDREGTPNNLAELIAMRKLRQSTRKEGIELEKLNAANRDGVKRKRKKRKGPDDEVEYGLRRGNAPGDDGDSDEDEGNSITRKIMKTDNFTHQTGIVDVDKHMMAYIEKELQKRRGLESGDFDAEKEIGRLDPNDELFKIAEKYRIQKTSNDEGNVATSSAMLTAIPEVDLGIDNRLKNIEATEIAKRKILEQREKLRALTSTNDAQYGDYHDPTYAGSRCTSIPNRGNWLPSACTDFYRGSIGRDLESVFRHAKGNQTDFDALRAAKIEAGIEDDSDDEAYESDMKKFFEKEAKNVGRGQMATDDIVAERFKRKGLLQTKGKFR